MRQRRSARQFTGRAKFAAEEEKKAGGRARQTNRTGGPAKAREGAIGGGRWQQRRGGRPTRRVIRGKPGRWRFSEGRGVREAEREVSRFRQRGGRRRGTGGGGAARGEVQGEVAKGGQTRPPGRKGKNAGQGSVDQRIGAGQGSKEGRQKRGVLEAESASRMVLGVPHYEEEAKQKVKHIKQLELLPSGPGEEAVRREGAPRVGIK